MDLSHCKLTVGGREIPIKSFSVATQPPEPDAASKRASTILEGGTMTFDVAWEWSPGIREAFAYLETMRWAGPLAAMFAGRRKWWIARLFDPEAN
jgi:hypothetical protein